MLDEVVVESSVALDTGLEIFRLYKLSVFLEGSQQFVVAAYHHLIYSFQVVVLCLHSIQHFPQTFNLFLLLSNDTDLRSIHGLISQGFLEDISNHEGLRQIDASVTS